MLNCICHLSAHSTRLSKHVWSYCLSRSAEIWCPALVSSANLRMTSIISAQQSISFINIIKASGPRIDPCGTPDLTSDQSEWLPLMTTFCFLPLSHWWIQFMTFPWMPWAWIFSRRRCLGTLSKAFAKSGNTMSTDLPCSWALARISRKDNRFVRQDYFLRKPCWEDRISWLEDRCSTISSQIIDSISLQGISVRDTGR